MLLTVGDTFTNNTAVITTEQVACILIHLSVLSYGEEIVSISTKTTNYLLTFKLRLFLLVFSRLLSRNKRTHRAGKK